MAFFIRALAVAALEHGLGALQEWAATVGRKLGQSGQFGQQEWATFAQSALVNFEWASGLDEERKFWSQMVSALPCWSTDRACGNGSTLTGFSWSSLSVSFG